MYRLRRHVAKSLGNCRQVATTPFSTARQGVAARATRRRSSSGATTSTSDARFDAIVLLVSALSELPTRHLFSDAVRWKQGSAPCQEQLALGGGHEWPN